MGDYKTSVNWHYSKGNISALLGIVNDETIDEDDRELAKKLVEELKSKNNNCKEKENDQER